MKKLFLFLLLVPFIAAAQLRDSMSATLKEVIINPVKTSLVLQSGTENVVDYSFADTNILISSYSGFNGNKAKLFLMTPYGDTLSMLKTKEYPVALFKSCTGKNYFISSGKFYQVVATGEKLQLGESIDIQLFKSFTACQTCIGDRLFYKHVDRPMFKITLNTVLKNDTNFRNIYSVESPATAMASYEELMQALALIECCRDYNGASKIIGKRNLLDKSTLSRLSFSVFRQNNNLVVFDYATSYLRRFNAEGLPTDSIKIGFAYKLQKFELLQDAKTEKIYFIDNRNPTATVQEIDAVTATPVGLPKSLGYRFITHLKINNGYAYYLWQNEQTHTVNQLYREQLK